MALASCDKEPQSSDLILPGAKGDLKLDRCYRGRDHLVCSFNALLKEAKSLLEDYRKIVEARYPEVSNVGAICNIKPDNLAVDMQNATDFANRFKALKADYDTRINCANKVGQSLLIRTEVGRHSSCIFEGWLLEERSDFFGASLQ